MVRSLFSNSVFIFLLITFCYLIGLWNLSIPLTGDQKVYLSIALEMFEKKEWIIPSLFNEPNFLKPPLQYWATLVGWNVFGLSVFGALLPSVLSLLASSVLVFKIGKKINLKSPLVAAVLFASTIGSMTYGSTAQMEIWIVLFMLGAWFAVLESKIFLAYLLVGLMALVKGPLYPVLWTMSYLVWDLKEIKNKNFWGALFFGILIGLSWYVLAAATHQASMLNQFLYSENFAKIHTQHGTMTQLWIEFCTSLFPWVFILIASIFQENNRERWKQNQRFYLSFGLLSAVFFTLFPYRVNSYLYFLTPVMAMLASEVELSKSQRKWVTGVYGIVFVAAVFLVYKLFQSNWIGVELLIGFTVASIIFLIGSFRGWMNVVGVGSLILVSLIRISGVQIGEKDIAGLRELASDRTTEIAYFIDSLDYWHEFGMISAALGKPIKRIYREDEIDSFLAHGGSVILADHQSLKNVSQLKCVGWNRLKRRTKFPFEKVLEAKISFGDQEINRVYQFCSASQ